MSVLPFASQADWRSRLMAAVTPLDSGVAQLVVNGYKPPGQEAYRPRKTAAVLVPLLDQAEPAVVLTRRADHLPQHPGQISFPGGAAEAQDQTAVHTALREAQEEIGLSSNKARPIGFLDRLDTISDYRILPVVALIESSVIWQPDAGEVAEVFSVPLSHILDLDQYENRPIMRAGVEYSVWYLPYRKHMIWGATAAMLLNLANRYSSAEYD